MLTQTLTHWILLIHSLFAAQLFQLFLTKSQRCPYNCNFAPWRFKEKKAPAVRKVTCPVVLSLVNNQAGFKQPIPSELSSRTPSNMMTSSTDLGLMTEWMSRELEAGQTVGWVASVPGPWEAGAKMGVDHSKSAGGPPLDCQGWRSSLAKLLSAALREAVWKGHWKTIF